MAGTSFIVFDFSEAICAAKIQLGFQIQFRKVAEPFIFSIYSVISS